jgi:hypothetical protein
MGMPREKWEKIRAIKPKDRHEFGENGQWRISSKGEEYVKTEHGNWMKKEKWLKLQERILERGRSRLRSG